eukprot:CAMPEP_0174835480 /NCGR_PEP_ID=MMETSP1114-20130205/5428_1 /TAXON_ID=312471 /ORGANISM="Neobodo designis, Strain CCAP 1951/1" /LENGTH=162 /DNA_ID=CAMNT_0016069429 /DNA_START=39 /DNA_END=527 /DNA_ORIENTATION=-
MDAQSIESFVRANWTFVIAALLAGYFGIQYLRTMLQDRAGRKETERIRDVVTEEERAERVRAARERQQAYVAEQTKKDEELRRERQQRELEEKILKSQAAQAARNARGAGNTTGGSNQDGPLSKLPRLPGGSRDSYEPTSTGGGSCGYRPSNPNIAKMKRGG